MNYRFRSISAINVFRGFGYVCNGNEATITNCQLAGSSCSPSQNSVGIQCKIHVLYIDYFAWNHKNVII